MAKKQNEKYPYTSLEIEIIYFGESFIRTSFGNDGNDDDWEDENVKPVGFI